MFTMVKTLHFQEDSVPWGTVSGNDESYLMKHDPTSANSLPTCINTSCRWLVTTRSRFNNLIGSSPRDDSKKFNNVEGL